MIDNETDVFDSRDVIFRIAELEDERDGFTIECDLCEGTGKDIDTSNCVQCQGTGDVSSPEDWETECLDDAEELNALLTLRDRAEGYSEDWKYGATLIRDSYFEQYAEQTAEDIGAIDRNASWPLSFIDWEAAAEALKGDYTSVDFGGVTYWVR